MTIRPTPPPPMHPVTRALQWLMMVAASAAMVLVGAGAYQGLSFTSTAMPAERASGSPRNSAAASLPSVSPSPSPAGTQPPLPVVIMTAVPEPIPTLNSVQIQKTAAAAIYQTATAEARPRECPINLNSLPAGTLCRYPENTPTPVFTSTPFVGCANPLPGELCVVDGEWAGVFAPTPVLESGAAGNVGSVTQ